MAQRSTLETVMSAMFSYYTYTHISIQATARRFQVSQHTVAQNPVNLGASSLFVFDGEHIVRVVALRILYATWFRYLILVLIVINSATLALRSPELAAHSTEMIFISWCDFVIMIVFMFEACIKVVALGLVMHSRSYLRDPWNILDLIVIGFSFEDFVNFDGVVFGTNPFTAVRVIRVLRPFRALGYLSSLRHLVNRLFHSLPDMGNVFVLLVLMVWFVAASGVQLFSGLFLNRCHADISSIANESSLLAMITSPIRNLTLQGSLPALYALVETDLQVCSVKQGYGRKCGPDVLLDAAERGTLVFPQVCLSLPQGDKSLSANVQSLNFDNIINAVLVSFKMVCKDNWPDDFKNLANAVGLSAAFAFSFATTLVVGYMGVNLFTAVFEGAFSSRKRTNAEEMSEFELIVDMESSIRSGERKKMPNVVFTTLLGSQYVREVSAFSSAYIPDKIQIEESNDHSAWRLKVALTPSPARSSEDSALQRYYDREAGQQHDADDEQVRQAMPEPELDSDTTLILAASGVERAIQWLDRKMSPILARKGVPAVGRVVMSAQYNLVIVVMVLINVADLAASRYGQSSAAEETISVISDVMGWLFIAEMLIKMVGLGPSYFVSNWNKLDFVLCVISLPELVTDRLSMFSSLRALRVFRLLRLATRWSTLRRLLLMVGESIGSASSAALVGLIVILSYALLGEELFGVRIEGTRFSFTTFTESFLTIFVCITGENQYDMASVLAARFGLWTFLFFVTLTFFGNFVWTNLFIAVILEHFAKVEEQLAQSRGHRQGEDVDELAADDEEARQLARVLLRVTSPNKIKQATDEECDAMEQPLITLNTFATGNFSASTPPQPRNRSTHRASSPSEYQSPVDLLDENESATGISQDDREGTAESADQSPHVSHFAVERVFKRRASVNEGSRRTATEMSACVKDWEGVMHPALFLNLEVDHPVRSACIKVLRHPAYDWFSLFLTMTSSILLALDKPGDNEASWLHALILSTDIIFCCLFSVECAMKLVALGVYQHPGSYLKSPWNVLDIFVTLCSIAINFSNSMKWLRSLRILRVLNVSFTLRVITKALFHAVPQMGSVLIFVAMLFLVYGVVGLELFIGVFHKCTDPSVTTREECVGLYNASEMTSLQGETSTVAQRLWVADTPPSTSFDTIEQSLYTVFKLINRDGWFDPLYRAYDNTNNSHFVSALYFLSFVLIGSYFTVNLFVGALVDHFVFQRQRGEGYGLLTDSQSQWVLIQKVLFRLKLTKRPPRPTGLLVRAFLYDVMCHRLFRYCETAVVFGNGILVSLYSFSNSRRTSSLLDIGGEALLGLLTAFLIVRLIAVGPKHFVRRKTNCFDLAVVIGSAIAIASTHNSSAIVRMFRAMRLLLVFRRVPQLQIVLSTFYHSIPELVNVALLLTSMYFIFAVLGVQLFYEAHTIADSPYNEYVNFKDVGHGMVALYVMMTEEYWAEIIDAASAASVFAKPFGILFMVLASWIGSHLLVTVVIDVYGETQDSLSLNTSLAVVEEFRQLWVSFDPKGFRILNSWTLIKSILPRLSSRVWDRVSQVALSFHLSPGKMKHRVTAEGEIISEEVRDFHSKVSMSEFSATLHQLERMHIPIDVHKNCRYEDCLASIALRLFAVPVAEAIGVSQRAVFGVTWDENEYCIHHEYAANLLTRCVRRWLARRKHHSSSCPGPTGP